MYQMEKISTGIAYGTSAGSAGYWFLQWLDQVSPSQWAAIGVLGFKIREDKRKAARGE
ncbi:class II holin family protein [Shigella sonnei]|uniref:class II holin family protein n=1 Tax=Shigella sonnei TaxID=624 RepID=UPI0006996A46|nr:class II holin family protein [Shigella sonnei]